MKRRSVLKLFGSLAVGILPGVRAQPRHRSPGHQAHTSRGSLLYPGEGRFWLASNGMMTWDHERVTGYLETAPIRGHSTHIVVAMNTRTQARTHSKDFNCLASPLNERHALAVLDQIIAAGYTPWVEVVQQPFMKHLIEERGHRGLLDHVRVTAELVGDRAGVLMPTKELGDIYDGDFMDERNDLFKTLRKANDDAALACHDRGLTQISVRNFKNVRGPTISALQCGFSTPTGGRGRAEDGTGHGDSTYDGACGFVKSNKDRMDRRVRTGALDGPHYTLAFEHSIPTIRPWQQRGSTRQPWDPARTWNEALTRARIIADYARLDSLWV
ncbi:MAG TPA: hypothetical protein DGN59_13535 [Candidatus Latescibacteria bacterium]|nr:hypothetical protein [Candidatus Latescibacterota bacterium]